MAAEDAGSIAPAVELDEAKLAAFGAAMLDVLKGGAAGLMMSIGHRVGLFDAMAQLPPSRAEEIAVAAGLNERYVREWLGAVTCAGIIDYDAEGARFNLPPEHAAMTTRGGAGKNVAATAQIFAVLGSVEDQIVEKFRHGGGLAYPEYAGFSRVMGDSSAANFDAALVASMLPLVPGIIDALRAGITVADVGAGSGHAVNVMAREFPESRFVGFDLTLESIEAARAEAARWGLSNATFEVRDVSNLDSAVRFDFITTFDAIHDQAKPGQVVRGIAAALKPGSYWLCGDVGASSDLADNLDHPLGTFMYTVSCLHCMSVSLAYGGAGLGAMWGEQQATAMFAAAGFDDIEVKRIPGDPVNNYYVCRQLVAS